MKPTKRQKLPAGLWIIATPIGNLSDLSLRAQQALVEADVILCEDTRKTMQIISSLECFVGKKPILKRCDAYTSTRQHTEWMHQIQQGKNFAFVSDAGTPGISDPGSALVAEAWKAGIVVTPIVGPSIVTGLISIAGFQETPFTFSGFFPRKQHQQILQRCMESNLCRQYVWLESPKRIVNTLSSILHFNDQVLIIAAKELTKMHERCFRGKAGEVFLAVQQEIAINGAIGEWSFAIQFPGIQTQPHTPDIDEAAKKAFSCLLLAGISSSQASKVVSEVFHISKKSLYEWSLTLK